MRYIILFPILVLWCACSNNSEDSNIDDERMVYNLTMELKRLDTLTFHFPDTIPHVSTEISPFFSHDDESFSYLTEGKSGMLNVNRYNLIDQKWERIALNLIGPDRVYGTGAYALIDNEVYYFPLNESKVIRLSKQGVKIEEDLYSNDRMVAFNSTVKSPNISIVNNAVVFDITEYRSLDDPQTFRESKLVGYYDLKEKKLTKIIGYPEEFIGKTWSANDVGRNSVVVDSKVYMNFSKSKYIYVYDLEGRLLKKREIKVAGIKDSKGGKSQDPIANAMDQVNNGYYDNLIYDKWRNVFYRIGIHFDIDRDLASPEEFSKAIGKRTVTILTFNQELEVIAQDEYLSVETRLSESYYFVNKNGLYLYSSFDDSPEGVYTFVRLGLRELGNDIE